MYYIFCEYPSTLFKIPNLYKISQKHICIVNFTNFTKIHRNENSKFSRILLEHISNTSRTHPEQKNILLTTNLPSLLSKERKTTYYFPNRMFFKHYFVPLQPRISIKKNKWQTKTYCASPQNNSMQKS